MIATRPLLASLIVASFLAVAACGGDLSGPDGARSELQINRDKWRAQGLRDYSLTMTRACFCGDVGPFAVTVRGDSVVAAVRISDGAPSLVIAYLPTGKPVGLKMDKLSGKSVKARWYDPREGTWREAGEYPNTGTREFVAPAQGAGGDWVLVLDDAGKGYPTEQAK